MEISKTKIAGWFTKGAKARRRRIALLALGLILTGMAALDYFGPPGIGAEYIARPLLAGYHLIPPEMVPFSCPAEPSCSNYAYLATRDHGLLLGSVLTADRLIHEQGRLKEGPWVEIGDHKKLFDPPPQRTSFPLLFQWDTRPLSPTGIFRTDKVNGLEESRYKMGWRFLALGNWAGARIMFLAVKSGSKYGAKAAWLSARLETETWPKPKNAAWSGWFSLVPGLGQLWLDRPTDAAWAAGLTYGLGGAAVACLAVGSVVGTVVLGLPALAFYFGNIHNSLSTVARINELNRRAFLTELRNGVATVP